MLEDILKQIRAMLQNQLPTKFDQIELERADGVALENVQSFLIQVRQRDGRQKYPTITLWGNVTAATNALSRRRELWHRISIWITLREVSPDTERLQTKLWRYVEAMERVLASDPTLGGKALDSTVISHGYNAEREDFTGRASLTLEVLERVSTVNY